MLFGPCVVTPSYRTKRCNVYDEAHSQAADFQKLVAADSELLGGVSEELLRDLRKKYEPNVAALSRLLEMPLPSWLAADDEDAWESSPWQ